MANFCKKCGTPALDGALFCDECGNPLAAPTAMVPPPVRPLATTAPVAINKRALVIAGSLVAVLAVGGGGVAFMLAPEKASEASFSRAITTYLDSNIELRDRVLCLSNVPYQNDQVQISLFDQQNRQWMDALARSGLYSAAEEQTSGGLFQQTSYVYQITPAGKAAVRNKQLCLASGVKVKSVTGFDRVQEVNGSPSAEALAVVEIAGVTEWVTKSPDRNLLLGKLGFFGRPVQFPMVQIEKKWTVVDNKQREAKRTRASNPDPFGALTLPSERISTLEPASTENFLSKFKSLFSFGAAHPLVGKWRGFGETTMEFTSDTITINGAVINATFVTKGDRVTVTSPAFNGVGVIYKMIDKDTASVDMGIMEVELKRIK
jgi:hypothetical protein